MTTASLFEKLNEHELKMNRLNVQENEDKHVRCPKGCWTQKLSRLK